VLSVSPSVRSFLFYQHVPLSPCYMLVPVSAAVSPVNMFSFLRVVRESQCPPPSVLLTCPPFSLLSVSPAVYLLSIIFIFFLFFFTIHVLLSLCCLMSTIQPSYVILKCIFSQVVYYTSSVCHVLYMSSFPRVVCQSDCPKCPSPVCLPFCPVTLSTSYKIKDRDRKHKTININ
jgi:hypothetical protein